MMGFRWLISGWAGLVRINRDYLIVLKCANLAPKGGMTGRSVAHLLSKSAQVFDKRYADISKANVYSLE